MMFCLRWTIQSVLLMAHSGARGSIRQITQIIGMRGLMMDPSGRFSKTCR